MSRDFLNQSRLKLKPNVIFPRLASATHTSNEYWFIGSPGTLVIGLGYFQVPRNLTFKMRPRVKPSGITFQNKCFTLVVVLKQRLKGNQEYYEGFGFKTFI